MIAIVDYGLGNLKSIYNMLKKIGVSSVITSDPNIIMNSDKIILPGVGSFDEGMRNIRSRNLEDSIINFALKIKKPILGICLGMQLLGKSSQEGVESGLGIIDMSFNKFRFNHDTNLKIPHMGWNSVITKKSSPITNLNLNNPRFYFVHSYYAVCNSIDDIAMEAEYGFTFTVAIAKENVYGVQFHPEKSHIYGMELLKKFADL